MLKKSNVDWIQLSIIAVVVVFLIEIIFMDSGLLFLVVLASIALYFGRRSYHKVTGKTIFWGGVFFLFITLIDTFAIRLLLLTVIAYFLWNWYQKKQHPAKQIPPSIDVTEETIQQDQFFQSKWFAQYHTTENAFAWEDMNMQSGIGDVKIDLNNTMLPTGESVIVFRHLFGNVQVIIPYDVEASIHHSVVFGDIYVFDHQERNAFNRTIRLQTKGYHASSQKVKIVTQVVAGKLEVKRG
ncbi:cell wall-active antibiotics response protein LiaF [Gracilibacillus sp. YIM 98692]|uniref:cell wall-active antibiotics response protein LiaF n=1 Tax=Gracilibacillus sp. YIM 98692 TaxID=2663532 RepID=UPI0013D74AB5|nr:cell wall-active antibiotics response protein LiaF [Gracilibacillus sp. YIM 98692]